MKSEEKYEVIKLTLESFIPWIEAKFNEKYEFCLDSLKERFSGIYTLFKLILEKVMEMDEVLFTESNETNPINYKPIIDNMIRLLDMMLKEFPECLDLEFVEYFFNSVQERIHIFAAHLHQIRHHFTDPEPNINNKISKINL